MPSTDPQNEAFVIRGSLRERETGRPLPDLIVRAFDRDWISDDKLGAASSDRDGEFVIRFRRQDFQDFTEQRPDLYLRVYDRLGTRLIHETRDAVRWNASPVERFDVSIPARALDPRAR